MGNEKPDPKPSRLTTETGLILVVVVVVVCAGMPWILERQTRRNLAQAHGSCERLLGALLSYRTDHGSIPAAAGQAAYKILSGEQPETTPAALWAFLTTPRAYLSTLPEPPFKIRSQRFHGFLPFAFSPGEATGVIAVVCSGPGGPPDPSRSFAVDTANAFGLVSGPGVSLRRSVWYAPSNGMISAGWIYRDSSGHVSPGG